METITLYFVGFYKHNGIQSLLSGPFVDYETADNACSKLITKRQYGQQFRIVRVTLPIQSMEVL